MTAPGSPSRPLGPGVVVIGGGIAGLTAAWRLVSAGVPTTILESSARWGGKILTTEFAGTAVDAGPDAFLARRPEAVGLCRELGLADELVAPGTGTAFLWTRGGLQNIPSGTVLGIPTGVGWWRETRAVSWPGKLRSGLDSLLPTTRRTGDRSVGELVSSRMGRQVAARLVDPLLGGINAGRIERLSLEASAPQVATAASSGHSLGRALRAQQRAVPSSASDTPVFNTLRAGLGHLVVSLVDHLEQRGAELKTLTPATGLSPVDGAWRVITADGAVDARAVVIATPAFAAASLLGDIAPDAAADLAAIDYASVVLATLAFPGDVRFPEGSGFLVPRVDGRLMTACTWFTSKWPHVRRGEEIIVRLSAGKTGDERAMALDDEELLGRLRWELAEATGCDVEPLAERVTRWPRSFPQYDVGHLERVDRIEDLLPHGIALAGAALRGVGIPACIASGDRAAATLLTRMGGIAAQ